MTAPTLRTIALSLLGLAAHGLAPAARAEGPFVSTEGVPLEVEEMYRKGLRFLAASQTAEGNFKGGHYDSQPGVVGLAGIAFLAHGDDPNTGPYAAHVRRVADFIVKQQRDDGYIGDSMYNHAFATLFLAEAYGMVADDRIGPALQKAVKLIADAQAHNPFGAWRYSPDATDADTTVSGACFVALAAAANAGIKIPDKAFPSALKYFRLCQSPDGSVGYTSGNGGNPTLTAIGALCHALSKNKTSPAYLRMTAFLEDRTEDSDRSGYVDYARYYRSQAYFHAGAAPWASFNAANIADLRQSQADDGQWPGNMGPVFSTSASLLSLALNYRFLPIYER